MASSLAHSFVSSLNRVGRKLGFQILSTGWHSNLVEHFGLGNAYKAYSVLCQGELGRSGLGSYSQRGQDAIAYFANKMIQSGFFIEIGAADGVSGSNTYALERLGWKGLLVEPAQVWHKDLRRNRVCDIDTRAVWHTSGQKLKFLEQGELSTFEQKKDADFYSRKGKIYEVETVSISELFETWGVPRSVEFLSIDTEGSELEILRGIDFSRYSFGFLCVEHNYSEAGNEIKQLLESVGYEQIMSHSSLNDYYFVPAKNMNR